MIKPLATMARALRRRRMRTAIVASIRGEAGDRGFRLHPDLRLTVEGACLVMRADRRIERAPARLDADGRPHPLASWHARHLSMELATDDARRDAVTKHAERDGLTPAWSRLIHPLALRLFIEGGRERTSGPYDWDVGPGEMIPDFRISGERTVLHVERLMLNDEEGRTRASFLHIPDGEGPVRAQIAVPTVVPHSAAAGTEGRPLSDLIGFAECGDDEVDAAVASLAIHQVDVHPASTVITLKPTRWIPFGPPPAYARGWDDAAPYVD